MQSQGWIRKICLLFAALLVFVSAQPQLAWAQTEAPKKSEAKPTEKSKAEGKAETEGKAEADDPGADEPSEGKQKGEQKKKAADDKDPKGEKAGNEKSSDEKSTADEKGEDKKKNKADENGSKTLDEAFKLNLSARTTADLDRVAMLCGVAIEKGLDESETEQAKSLAAESLLRFAESLGRRTFQLPRDPRWQVYRAQAMPRLKKAIDFNENSIDAYILLAKFQAIDSRERGDAMKNIQKAIELAAEDRGQLSDALVIRAGLTADKEARIADLKQAIKLNPVNYRARELRGRLLLSDSKVEEALEDFEVMLEGQPKNFLARLFVATSLRQTGDKFTDELQQKAMVLLDEASAIQPKADAPFVLKSQIYLDQKKYEQSVEAATRAIELNQKNPGPFSIRALARAAVDDFDGAYDDANSLIKLNTVAGYSLRIDLFAREGRFDKAIEDLKVLGTSQPSDNLKRRLAIYYNANLQPKEAIKIYNRLLRGVSVAGLEGMDDNNKRVVLSRRADLLSLRGNARLATAEHAKAVEDYSESLELFDQLLEMLPEEMPNKPTRDTGLLNNFAWVLSTSPDDDVRDGAKAIELAEEAAEITEFKRPHILSTVASAYAETGDFEKAIEWIEKGIEANKAAADELRDEEETARQHESLMDELKSYEDGKPWRESQDIEKERRERDEKLAEKESKKSDDAEEGDSPEEDKDEEAQDEEAQDKNAPEEDKGDSGPESKSESTEDSGSEGNPGAVGDPGAGDDKAKNA